MSDFHASVARIHAVHEGGPHQLDGSVVGAGFLVAPGLVVTCAHVLSGVPDGARVQVCFPQAEGSPQVWGQPVPDAGQRARGQDVAFLQLDEAPAGIPVLGLRSVPGPEGSAVWAFGFPAQAPPGGHPGPARIGRLFTGEGSPLLELTDANALAKGFSGSPVVDGEGLVVGMVTAYPGPGVHSRGEDLAYAIPTGVLQQVEPGLRMHLECPYPGLAPFGTQESRWYHGRTVAVTALVDRLRSHHGVLALLGPSGSGKSSLIAAGLIPELARGRIPDLDADQAPKMLRPSTDLAAVADALEEAVRAGRPALVVIDQFEELLTCPGQPEDSGESSGGDLVERILAALTQLSTSDTPTRVLLVLRDDFYPHLARRSPALMDHLNQGRIVSLNDQLTPDDLRDIISEPAHTQNWNIDPILTERLIRDLLDQRTKTAALTDLPLLALTLRRIWDTATKTPAPAIPLTDQRATPAATAPVGTVDNTLTAQAYDRLGGVRSAFATWCDQAYRDIPTHQQATARALLTALVHDGDPDRGIPSVRQRRTVSELTARVAGVQIDQSAARTDAAEVLNHLIDLRIVTTSQDSSTREVVAELAHDTLIEHWDALHTWLERDRDLRAWLNRTEERAQRWDQTGRRSGFLEDDELAEALRHQNAGPITDSVTVYIGASRSRQQTRARTRRLAQTALATLTVLALIIAWIAYDQRGQAIQARNQAITNQVIAEAGQLRSSDASLAAQLDLAAHRMGPTPDSTIRLLDTTQVALATVLTGYTGSVKSVVFSPNGKILASSANDTVQLSNVADPAHPIRLIRLRQLPTGQEGSVTSVAFSPDSKTLASSADNTVQLWNVTDPAHPIRLGLLLTGQEGSVTSVAFSPDSKTLASSGDGTVRLWNVTDPAHPIRLGQPLTGHDGDVASLAFSPNGKTLASGSYAGTVQLWNVTDPAHPIRLGQPLTGPTAPTGPTGSVISGEFMLSSVASLAFSPDSKTLASGSEDNTVRLWKVTDPAHPIWLGQPLTGPTGLRGPVTSVAFSPNGKTLASSSDDSTVRLWSLPLTTALTVHAGCINSVVFSADGKTLASGSCLHYGDGGTDGGDGDGMVRVWNVTDPAHPVQLGQPLTGYTGSVKSVVFSPNGKTLVSSSLSPTDNSTVRLWNVTDPAHPIRLGQLLTGHDGSVTSVAFSPDSKTLAMTSSDDDNTVRLWNVTDPAHPIRLGQLLTGHDGPFASVAFSPDSKTLASSSDDDNTVRLWNVTDPAHPIRLGQPLMTGRDSGVASVVFSPNGKTLASSSGDTVWLWNVTDPAHPVPAGQPLTGHTGAVTSVAFSPNGKTLASSGDDTVLLWDRDVDHAIERICTTTDSLTRAQWARYVPQLPYDPPCSHRLVEGTAR